MSFFILDREIRQMIRRIVLQTPIARAIARKAGLRSGAATVLPKPHTAFSGYVSPYEEPFGRQYQVDLSNYTQIRFTAQANVDIYLFLSSSGATSNLLDPNNYTPMFLLDPDDPDVVLPVKANAAESLSGDVRWFTLFEDYRIELRLTISTDEEIVALDHLSLDGPFAMMLQAR